MWVSNKRGHSISVIDRQTMTVIATIPLERGSRPRGIVSDSTGLKAYVALEATGQLVRFNAQSRQIEATLDLGSTFATFHCPEMDQRCW